MDEQNNVQDVSAQENQNPQNAQPTQEAKPKKPRRSRKKKDVPPTAADAANKLAELMKQDENLQEEIARWTQIAEDAKRNELLHILSENNIVTPDDLQKVFREWKNANAQNETSDANVEPQNAQPVAQNDAHDNIDMSDNDRAMLSMLHAKGVNEAQHLNVLLQIRDVLHEAKITNTDDAKRAAEFFATCKLHNIDADEDLDSALDRAESTD